MLAALQSDPWAPHMKPPGVLLCPPAPHMALPRQVKKIHENEKRLEAGDHTVELLARDFEKNYNMYIFPVHWQFGQLDQHPIDG